MKIYLTTLIATSLVALIILQKDSVGEAKKIKLKDLKKVKKYAYLLAGQSKRLYAIPFPVPLPVIVKRQHIYTQVPVVPRYVHRPQQPEQHQQTEQHQQAEHYHYPSAEMEAYEGYSSAPAAYTTSEPKQSRQAKKQTTSTQAASASTPSSGPAQSASRPTRYLAQLASAISQVYPSLGNLAASASQRNVVAKLLSGQSVDVFSSDRVRVGSLLSGFKTSMPRPDHELEQASNITIKESDLANSATANEGNIQKQVRPHQQPHRTRVANNNLYRPRPPALVQYGPLISPLTGRDQQHQQMHQVLHPMIAQLLAQQQQPAQSASELAQSLGYAAPVGLIDPYSMQVAQSASEIEPMPSLGQVDAERVLDAMQRARHQQALLMLEREKEARLGETSPIPLAVNPLSIYPEHQLSLISY